MSVSYGIYIYSIFKGGTKPHPFSWFIWGSLTAIAFFAQISDEAGVGAIITGLSAIISLFIAGIGYVKRKNITISVGDKWAFALSLLAIPLWLITNTPFWSVILISLIDVMGFYPTFRKTWFNPEQEVALSYTIGGFKHLMTLFALENFTTITALYPLSLLVMNFSFITLLYYRRWSIKNE